MAEQPSQDAIQSEMLIDDNTLAVHALAHAGMQHTFGMVGIPVTFLITHAMAVGIYSLTFHSEQFVGYTASAYGNLMARPNVLLTIFSPSCVHGLVGLSNGAANTWPILMISRSCDQADADKGNFQELNQTATVPFVKHSAKVTHISHMPRLNREVMDRTASGRLSGCYLNIPSDVLHYAFQDLFQLYRG